MYLRLAINSNSEKRMLLRKGHAAATRLSQLPCPMPPFCAAVAKADTAAVQSDIVGYQQVALPANGQYALLTPTFKDVGGAATIDLTDIAVVKPGNTSFTSKKKVMIQKMDLATGGMTTAYLYTTAGSKWVNQSGADVTVGEVTFAAGEGMCVYNGDSAGTELAFQFSGAVELNPVSLDIPSGNYTLVGNLTPATVDLTEVAPLGAGGTALGTSKKKIMIQKVISGTGGMGTAYLYTTAGNKWVDQSGTDVAVGDVTFTPGEAMCVYNGDTKVVSLSFPSPVTK